MALRSQHTFLLSQYPAVAPLTSSHLALSNTRAAMQVSEYFEQIISSSSYYVIVKLNLALIRELFLEIDIDSVISALAANSGKLKLKAQVCIVCVCVCVCVFMFLCLCSEGEYVSMLSGCGVAHTNGQSVYVLCVTMGVYKAHTRTHTHTHQLHKRTGSCKRLLTYMR